MSDEEFKVLTLSTVFPNPAENDFGLFIYRRMKQVAGRVPVTVVAPVAVVEYGNPNRKFPALGQIPRRRRDGPLDIRHPRYFYPPLGGFANGCFLYAQIRGCVRKLEFDVIDAHFGHPEGVAAALLARATGKPFVITLRGNEPRQAEHPARRRAMAWALKRAARVVAVSERLRRFAMAQGCEAARVAVIGNGIDGDTFHPRGYEEARRELGIDPGTRLILSAGYLIERKGHHRVAEALRGLRERGMRAELAIAGGPGREGEFEGEIRRRVSDLKLEDAVRFVGAVTPDELARWMSACDVFCLASRNEGWPNVVHEAMGCGAPVVATDTGAIPEMIVSGEYGQVVPFGDKNALQDALGAALEKNWNRAAISQWALGRSWEKVAAEVVALLREVVMEHRA